MTLLLGINNIITNIKYYWSCSNINGLL